MDGMLTIRILFFFASFGSSDSVPAEKWTVGLLNPMQILGEIKDLCRAGSKPIYNDIYRMLYSVLYKP
jgi:hypothetical protein